MCKSKLSKLAGPTWVCASALLGLSTLLPIENARAQVPPGCLNGGMASVINVSPTIAHIGDTVTITHLGVSLGGSSCNVTNGQSFVMYPNGNPAFVAGPPVGNGLNGIQEYETNFFINQGQTLDCLASPTPAGACALVTLTYTIQAGDVNKPLSFTTPRGFTSGSVPGTPKTVKFLCVSDGLLTGSGGTSTAGGQGNAAVTILTPLISVTKQCVTNCPPFSSPYGQPIDFVGTVCNTGDTTLIGVTVTDSPSATITFATTTSSGNPFPAAGGGTLTNGECVTFSGSYQPTGNLCGPFADTVIASGTDSAPFPVTVFATNSAVCTVCTSPAIAVTKACPPGPVQPGGTLNFTGTVTNTGNVPLTNVVVVNNQPAPNTVVLGPITLAPGAGQSFSGSYTVPLDSCGPYADTVTATGASVCGSSVTNTFTAVCPGTNSPNIAVTKACPTGPVQPGGTLNFTGTVTNTGNITLTNVIVRNNQPAPNTVVLGPITLAPGAGQSFSGSYTVPLDSCGPYPDTVMATGAEKCFGHSVTNSFTAVCPGTNSPNVAVTKSCPPAPVQPGGTLNFTGTVTNTGNITLTNVIVVNNQPAPNTMVLGPITLAPGAGQSFSGSYTVPLDSCGPYPDTVVATGAEKCFGHSVTNSFTAVCPGTNSPNIVVVKLCPPGTTVVGGNITVNGFVTNTGNITLTNVIVKNVVPAIGRTNNSVLGPISLAPGAFAPFSDTYNVGPNCPSISDTVTASGADKCFGRIVSATAGTNCPVACPPKICVTKEIACFLGTNAQGQEVCGTFGKSATGFKVETATSTNLPAFCYSITVSNCGRVGLTNVTVIDDKFGDLTADFPCVAGVFAPGASCAFVFKTSLEFDQTNTVIASGKSVANGQTVTAQDLATGHVFVASIACNKLVTSPDDLDGNTNDNHVLFPCGSGQHLVSYSVVVTNTGEADFTNVVISDPTLAALCTLPGPFTLAAGASTNISLCGNIPFNCGSGAGGSNNTCANPLLGSATGCTVLELDGHQVSITGPPGGIQGDVCIGPNGKLSITGSEYVTGNIKLAPGATYSKSGSGTIGGSVQHNVDLSSEINAALATASTAAAMPCTQTLGSLNLGNHVTNTITGNVGVNVICVHDIVLNTAVIQLSGPAGATFIVNITGKLVLNGTSHIVAAGGVRPKDILYNVIGTGQDVAFTGGGGGVNCCASSVDGTLLAPQRKINLSPGLVNGQVISGLDISIVSGSSVRCPPGCTPVSAVNTITINAEISESQSNTNILNACVRNINGQPITATSQCSASVECTK